MRKRRIDTVGQREGINQLCNLSLQQKLQKDFKKNRELYLLILPVLLYYAIFQYGPMIGLSIAFKNYTPARGFAASSWVGLKYFKAFFKDFYFSRIMLNTVRISVMTLVISFPMPIILALLINELRSKTYAKWIQTITYLPHFISVVVICGIIVQLTSSSGAITTFLGYFGLPQSAMLNNPKYFLSIYISSGIWQLIGWNSIIYLSALTAIDAELYEASRIDGAGKLRQLFSITLPCLAPTIIIMLILQVGKMFNIGYEKIILLYNPLTYEVADVISTYVYRKGLLEFNWSYSAAVGMFNSVISFALVYFTNKLSKKVSGSSLW
jgi:putative aldouronate transport system permease protein